MPVAGELREVLNIPDGVKVKFNPANNNLEVKGPLGTLSRTFIHPNVVIEHKSNTIQLFCEMPRKKDQALFGTWLAHIKNMLKGVNEGFEYKMKIVYAHFPIKTRVQDNSVFIENFLGEKQPRIAKIVGETKIMISGDQIILNGIDLEHVSQTAANIELATRIRNFDPRIFQDGIYITDKSTKE